MLKSVWVVFCLKELFKLAGMEFKIENTKAGLYINSYNIYTEGYMWCYLQSRRLGN